MVAGAPTTVNTYYIPAASGDTASTPDSVANSITGDIDIRVKVAMADWTPTSGEGAFVRKLGTSGNRSYMFYMNSLDRLALRYSAIGSTQLERTATAATGITDGTASWVRVTMDVDNGASQHEVKFYKSSDYDPVAETGTWTQIGATVTTAGTTSIFNSGQALFVGASIVPNTNFYYIEIRNGINGTVAVKFDPSAVTPTATRTPSSFVSTTGETWTMNGTTWDWVAASRATGPPPTEFIWANDNGAQDGVHTRTYVAFAFTPTASETAVGCQVRYGTGTIPTATGSMYLATYAAPSTPISSVESVSVSSASQGTWKSVVFDSPVSLTGGTEYAVVVTTAGAGLAYKATGTSTYSGLTSTRSKGSALGPGFGDDMTGFTGGFRIEVYQ